MEARLASMAEACAVERNRNRILGLNVHEKNKVIGRLEEYIKQLNVRNSNLMAAISSHANASREEQELASEAVRSLEAEVAGLEAKVAGLEAKVAGLEADVAGLNAKVVGLEKEVNSESYRAKCFQRVFLDARAAKEALQADKEALEADKEALQADNEALEADKEALKTANAALEAGKATLEAGKATLEAENASLRAALHRSRAEKAVVKVEESSSPMRSSSSSPTRSSSPPRRSAARDGAGPSKLNHMQEWFDHHFVPGASFDYIQTKNVKDYMKRSHFILNKGKVKALELRELLRLCLEARGFHVHRRMSPFRGCRKVLCNVAFGVRFIDD